MAHLSWKEDYSVKIKEVDEQHKKLIGLINDLHDAMAQKKAKEILGDVLRKLADYTVFHFTAEERLMKSNGYPEYEEHREKHQKMTAKVLSLQDELKQGKITLSMEVMDFLKNWLDKHIMGTDKKYSPFLTGKGVS